MQAINKTKVLQTFLAKNQTLVLSGAGISTDSGIPDYRSPERLAKKRNPIRYQQFMKDAKARQRYWARSVVGWPFVEEARPNQSHVALSVLEQAGVITGVLTQNVDGLHQQAGSKDVLELHGRLRTVICLDCGQTEKRERLQRRMLFSNPDFEQYQVELAPDGDADLPASLIESFTIPVCLCCNGTLKPDVVFFGENVPGIRVDKAWDMLDEASALLVVGSSLTVFSGYRFVARAAKDGKPVAIINRGPTRGDADATLKLDAPLGDVLPELALTLGTDSLQP